jgi:hypothetical protein
MRQQRLYGGSRSQGSYNVFEPTTYVIIPGDPKKLDPEGRRRAAYYLSEVTARSHGRLTRDIGVQLHLEQNRILCEPTHMAGIPVDLLVKGVDEKAAPGSARGCGFQKLNLTCGEQLSDVYLIAIFPPAVVNMSVNLKTAKTPGLAGTGTALAMNGNRTRECARVRFRESSVCR